MTGTTRILELLDRLIAFPTVSRDSNLELIDWAERLLKEVGFDVTRLWSPDRSKAGLLARIGPTQDGGVCLSAHSDVVPVDGQPWTRPPFRLTRDGDRLFGRGVTDMKGFLASVLACAERAGQARLAEPLTISLSYDEEVGCVGIREMLPEVSRLIGKPRAVIVGEPTGMQTAIGHKGKTALRVVCHGQAGHSALAPNFTNAIHVAARFVERVRSLQDEFAQGPQDTAYSVPYSTLHVGGIEGGKALNIVPDRAEIEMEFRHLPEVAASDISQSLTRLAKAVSAAFPDVAPIELHQSTAYPGLNTPPDHPVITWANNITGQASTTKVAFGTEAGFFDGLGLPTLVIGPGDMARDGHQPDESLDLMQLSACDAMMDRLIYDLSE